MPFPLVSIVIVTYNRWESLSRCLDSIRRVTYPNCEIIVVDNNSSDGTREKLTNNYPEVQLIRNKSNLGCGPARNIGINKARGEYIVQIDDDATINVEGIERFVDIFHSDNEVGIISPRITENETGLVATQDFIRNNKCMHGACSAFRVNVLKKTGLYPDEMFFVGEEIDLSIRIIDSGYLIRYAPEIKVAHYLADRENDSHISSWRLYNSLCSWLWFFVKYFPWPWVFLFWIRVITVHFILAVKNRKPLVFVQSLARSISRLPEILKKRRELKASTIRYFCNPNIPPDRYNVPLFKKLLRRFKLTESRTAER